MFVVDASAVAELLLDTPSGRGVADLIGDDPITAPQLLAVEVASVLRGWVRGRGLDVARTRGALDDMNDLGILWEDAPPLVPGAWELRDNLSSYDAVYVVLAQALACPLVTCDARLARAAPDVAVVPS